MYGTNIIIHCAYIIMIIDTLIKLYSHCIYEWQILLTIRSLLLNKRVKSLKGVDTVLLLLCLISWIIDAEQVVVVWGIDSANWFEKLNQYSIFNLSMNTNTHK